MISKIKMQNVASYKEETEIITDKKTILIYGLNGTGKSTFSNYLYNTMEQQYKECRIEGFTEDQELLVYNQQFVNENFYEADSLKGIFTLSKENKQAKQAIDAARNKIEKIKAEKEAKSEEYHKKKDKYFKIEKDSEKRLWEVKTKYTGGDRVLEFCLEGLKGSASKLFEYAVKIPEQKLKPVKTIEDIKKEVAILGNTSNKLLLYERINANLTSVENDDIFRKIIVGNDNSTVAKLINELGNSDWVKLGLVYVDEESEENQKCPFCQSNTITSNLIDNIKGFFDESYEKDIESLIACQTQYDKVVSEIESIIIESNEIIEKNDLLEFEIKRKELLSIVEENRLLISEKIKMPSRAVELKITDEIIKELNECIDIINQKIKDYNEKIDNKEATLNNLKEQFWKNVRWDYDVTIKQYFKEKDEFQDATDKYNDEMSKLKDEEEKENVKIVTEQKKTVNVEEAIANINNGLIELGIGDFCIAKDKNETEMYKVVRDNQDENIFKSLSEGEKMLISFLYFIELCKGKKNATEADKRKIVVIDDPITSMSHVYIFNIGRMIHNEFLRTEKYEQVFVLTHSLYFFYELACMKKKDRDEYQKLVRISKGVGGSKFVDMHYNEIENEYQSYWSIVKDSSQKPALIANCMRNIIEYFFNFVEKQELSNVFDKPSLKENKYQAFYRYINRESHSMGQNLLDLKEFDYDVFKEAFREVFVATGYEIHYKKMMK